MDKLMGYVSGRKIAQKKIKGTVVMVKQKTDVKNFISGVLDWFCDHLLSKGVSLQLISSVDNAAAADPVVFSSSSSSSSSSVSKSVCLFGSAFVAVGACAYSARLLLLRVPLSVSVILCCVLCVFVADKLIMAAKNKKKGEIWKKYLLGKEAFVENWTSKITSVHGKDEASFDVFFNWDEKSQGIPGAFIIRNHHHRQFYLKRLTLEDVPSHDGPIQFICDSWVYPTRRYNYERVFFTNKTYLPDATPKPIRYYREQELMNLQGKGVKKDYMFKEWDRVYDYAIYNDLGSPEKGKDYARPPLGGSSDYPYPRRGKTGRKSNKDRASESRLSLLSFSQVYAPRDEKFTQVKFSDFIRNAVKSIGLLYIFKVNGEFETFQDVLSLYDDGVPLSHQGGQHLDNIRAHVPRELFEELKEFIDVQRALRFPLPDIIKDNKISWRTDREFAREMLAGVNPVIIRRLEAFPPTSKLDRRQYGNQDSTIKKEHIEKHMNGLSVDKALGNNKLFILDHHDALMPYVRRINTTATKTYASRTILLLQDDGTLKPLAIELSLPHEQGDERGAISQVFTPSDNVDKNSLWQLAKAYVAVNDSGYHQLISHWLNTHAVIEPFIIATNRQLSVVHPIHKLLKPHFLDTMHLNASARQALVNAGGILEKSVFPGRYGMEMSSAVYKNWNFTEQALPQDLIKRGMAIPDSSSKSTRGLELFIKDYPFAVDGLDIWYAIESWVEKYCRFYYPTDDVIKGDYELKNWWRELIEQGHGDLKEKSWWPKMETRAELIQTCTIIIWVASALHAAVNFGQYPYGGYIPNRPTMSRRFMPEPGTDEYSEMQTDPNLALLRTIPVEFETLLGISLIEILSRHSAEEVYLGQRDTEDWTTDEVPLKAFREFTAELKEIEMRITDRNENGELRNRAGPVKLPYTLLCPSTPQSVKEGGSITGKGIPNSVSI